MKECESVNTLKCINCDGAHKSTDPVCEKYKEKLAVINDLNNNLEILLFLTVFRNIKLGDVLHPLRN